MSQSPKNLSHLQLEQLEDRQMLSTVSIFVSGSDLPVRLVTKYNPDGSVDTNFASGNPFGDGTIGITGPFSLINASFTPDNHILIAGDRFIDGGRVTVEKYDLQGSLVSDFNGGGGLLFGSQFGTVADVFYLDDGSTVLASRFTLAKFDANGILDTSFDGDGILSHPLGGITVGRGFEVDSSGAVIVAASADPGTVRSNTLFARVLPDGTVDGSFRQDALVAAGIRAGDFFVDSQDRIIGVIAEENGSEPIGERTYFRLNPNGELDLTFGDEGFLVDSGSLAPEIFDRLSDSLSELPDGGILSATSAGVYRFTI